MNACARMPRPETASSTLRGPSEIVVMACPPSVGVGARERRLRRSDRTRSAVRYEAGGRRLDEREHELALAAAPPYVERVRDATQEGDDRLVVTADGGDEPRDAGRACVRRELLREHRADAATLELVRDLEGDLARRAVPHEAGDPRGRGAAVDVRDEDVVGLVDPRQHHEVAVGESGLRPAEPALPRRRAEACEQRLDRRGVPVAERADRHASDVACLHRSIVPIAHGSARRVAGPSS